MPLPDTRLHHLQRALQHMRMPGAREAFPEQALAALKNVLPADLSAYNEVNPQTLQMRVVGLPESARFPRDLELWLQHSHEHPMLMHTLRTGDRSARKFSDFLTPQQLRRSTLYQAFYRRLAGEHQMSITLDVPAPHPVIAFAFNRAAVDFSEDDRTLLNLLSPVLSQMYLQAEAHTQLQAEVTRLRRAFDALDRGIVFLTMDGRVQLITPQAQHWLRTYCPAAIEAWEQGLPNRVRAWLQQHLASASLPQLLRSLDPLFLQGPKATLEIRYLYDTQADGVLLLMQERRQDFSPATLAPLGFSKRECEILYWLILGKTNPEIGLLLGIRPGTVRTRLEDIFSKLGVHTRTAAAQRIRDLLAQPDR